MSVSDIEYEDGRSPQPPTAEIEPRLTGVVKWFNNKSGFGFITVCQESHPLHSKDIFCYYKSLRIVNLQFRYLVQGEYVDFTLVKAAVEPHEYQAVDVTGVQGGPLMCETRSIAAPKGGNSFSTAPKGGNCFAMHANMMGPGPGAYNSHSKQQQQYTKRPPVYTATVASTATAPKKRPNHSNKPSADEDGFTRVNRHRKKTIVVV